MQIHPDPSHLGLVGQAARHDLDHDRVTETLCDGDGLVGRPGNRTFDQGQTPFLERAVDRLHLLGSRPIRQPRQAGQRPDRRPRLLGHRDTSLSQTFQSFGGLVSGHPQVEDWHRSVETQQCLYSLSRMCGRVSRGHRQHHVVLPRSGETIDDFSERDSGPPMMPTHIERVVGRPHVEKRVEPGFEINPGLGQIQGTPLG